MPYSSKKQSRFMHSQHPDIAARWDKEFPNQKNLPEKAKKHDLSGAKPFFVILRDKNKKHGMDPQGEGVQMLGNNEGKWT